MASSQDFGLSLNAIADVAINQYSFVKIQPSPTSGNPLGAPVVTPCTTTATDFPFGICQDSPAQFQSTRIDTVDGTTAFLKLGSGGATPGQYLGTDTSGNGISVSTSGYSYGAIALYSGNQGDIVEVMIMHGVIH